jgi:hypothetical protein
MQICQIHWDKLRAAIKDRGIDHLGAKNAKQAYDDMEKQVLSIPSDYDPLMSCNWMIQSKGLKMGGLYIMGQKDDGSHYCPICEAIVHKPDDAEVQWVEDYWIQGPADAALEECRKLGLAPMVQ